MLRWFDVDLLYSTVHFLKLFYRSHFDSQMEMFKLKPQKPSSSFGEQARDHGEWKALNFHTLHFNPAVSLHSRGSYCATYINSIKWTASTIPTDPYSFDQISSEIKTAHVCFSRCRVPRIPRSCTLDGSAMYAMWEVMFLAHVAPSFPEKAKVLSPVLFFFEDVWYVWLCQAHTHTSYIHIIHAACD